MRLLFRRCVFLLLVCFALGPPVFSQSKAGPFVLTAANQCAEISTTAQATIGIKVKGTFSMTLQPEISIQGQTADNSSVTPYGSQTSQATITAAGSYTSAVAAGDTFLLCVTSFSSGTATVWLNASTVVAGNLLGGAPVTSLAFSALTTGTNTTAAMAVGLPASLTPDATSGYGQITSNTNWYGLGGAGIYAPQVTLTDAQTGGSFIYNSGVFTQITISTATGESYPSLVQGTPLRTNCTSGSSCSLIVTAPSLPPGTTYTVYNGTTTSTQKYSACVHITGNCVMQTYAVGAAPPTSDTTGIYPTPANASTCPPGNVPDAWQQDISKTWNSLFGVNQAELITGYTNGFLEFCRPIIVNVSGVNDAGALNGAFNIYQQSGGTSNVFGEQIEFIEPAALVGTLGQQQSLYVENLNLSSATLNGIEMSMGAIRGVANAAGGTPVLNGGSNGTAQVVGVSGWGERGSITRSGNAIFAGLQGIASPNTNLGGDTFIGVLGQALNVGGDTAARGRALYAVPATSYPFTASTFASNVGVYSEDYGNSAASWDMWLQGNISTYDPTHGKVFIEGTTYVGGLAISQLAPLAILGSPVVKGSVGTAQLTAPTAPALSGYDSGSTHYSYALVALDGNGNQTAVSPTSTLTGGAATLNATNYEIICLNSTQAWGTLGWSAVQVWRTASGGSPSSTGLIGTMTAANEVAPAFGTAYTGTGQYNIVCMNDTGLAGDGTTAPTFNNTGAVQAYELQSLTNCAANGSAANPSLVACGSASAGAFSCSVTASTGTCVVSTTAVTANSEIFITPTAAESTRLSVTCNTAPTLVPTITLLSKSAGVSFTLTMPTIAVNPSCYDYLIVN